MGYNLKDNNNTKEEKCQQKLKDSLNKESQKLKNFEILITQLALLHQPPFSYELWPKFLTLPAWG